jgi:uncharacterized integral membrane protein
MRYIRYMVLAAMAIVLVTIALANRGALTLRLLPETLSGLFGFSWQITLPTFVVLLAAVLVGVLLGFVWEWVREHRHRAEAAYHKKERERLEREMKKTRPSPSKGDDVLALLETR